MVALLEEMVKKIVPSSEIGKYHGNELSFVLPLDKKKSFGILFDRLDKEIKSNPDVIDYGISTPTLEHIFYGFHHSRHKERTEAKAAAEAAAGEGSPKPKVGQMFVQEADGGQGIGASPNLMSSQARSNHDIRESNYDVRVKGKHHFFQEFKALAAVRFAKKANDICTFSPLILLPMILLLSTILFISLTSSDTSPSDNSFKRDAARNAGAIIEPGQDDHPTYISINSSFTHGIPVSLVQYVAKYATGDSKVSITAEQDVVMITKADATAAAAMIGIAFAFIPAGLMIEYIDDREVTNLHLMQSDYLSTRLFFCRLAQESCYGLLDLRPWFTSLHLYLSTE